MKSPFYYRMVKLFIWTFNVSPAFWKEKAFSKTFQKHMFKSHLKIMASEFFLLETKKSQKIPGIRRTNFSVFRQLDWIFSKKSCQLSAQKNPTRTFQTFLKNNSVQINLAVVAWLAKASYFHSVNSVFSASSGSNPACGMIYIWMNLSNSSW